MASSDPSGSGDEPSRGVPSEFGLDEALPAGSAARGAGRLPPGMESADDYVPEQEATRRAEMAGFRRSAGPLAAGRAEFATAAAHAAKEQLAGASRGAAIVEPPVPPVPDSPWVFESTHVVSKRIGYDRVLDLMARALQEGGIDFKYNVKKAKCRCFQYKVGSYCKFILRAFRNVNGSFVLEFQKREGSGSQFHAMYAQMLRAFDEIIDADNPVVLTQRDAPAVYATTVVEEGSVPVGSALDELPTKEPLPGEEEDVEEEEDPTAVEQEAGQAADVDCARAALAPIVSMLRSPYEEAKVEATQSIAELASDAATTALLVDCGTVRTLAELMASGEESTTIRTLATIAIAEVARHAVGQVAVVEVDGLPRALMDISQAAATQGGFAMRRAAVLALQRLGHCGDFRKAFAADARVVLAAAKAASAKQGPSSDPLMLAAADAALQALI